MEDFLVTIKLRVRVTDPESVLAAARRRDATLLDQLVDEPALALSVAIQDAVPPPNLRSITGLSLPGDATWASVKAEPWPTDDPW